MGRRKDVSDDNNPDDERQSTLDISQISPNSIKHESQNNPNQDFDENKVNYDDLFVNQRQLNAIQELLKSCCDCISL